MNLIISIKKEFAELIYVGTKTIEFRKSKPQTIPEIIYIYESGKNGNHKITASFKPGRIHKSTPYHIWQVYALLGGISFDKYCTYYGNGNVAVAIEITELHLYKHPQPLPSEITRAPQMYRYYKGSIPDIPR